MQPYAAREIRFHSLRDSRGWQLKTYTIRYGKRAFDHAGFESGYRAVEAELPQPAVAPGRLGVGFLIGHQGATGDYAVLAWWDQENELPLRLRVRRDASEPWRTPRPSESVCVWDLQVIWAEREAYIDIVLSGEERDARERYLARVATP